MRALNSLLITTLIFHASASGSMDGYPPFSQSTWPQTVHVRELAVQVLPDESIAITGGSQEFRILPRGDDPMVFEIAPVTDGQIGSPLTTGQGVYWQASVYEAELNGDGLSDYVVHVSSDDTLRSDEPSLTALRTRVLFLLSQGTSFTVGSLSTYGFDPRDLFLYEGRAFFLNTTGRMVEKGGVREEYYSFWGCNLFSFGPEGLIAINSIPRIIRDEENPQEHYEDLGTELPTPEQRNALVEEMLRAGGLSTSGLTEPLPDVDYSNRLQPVTELVERKSFGEYTVEIFGTDYSWFRIMRHGSVVYSAGGNRLHIGFQVGVDPWASYSKKAETYLPMGTDITGDGVPNLLVVESFPRFHIANLFEIGDSFRFIQQMDSGYFEDLNGDGAREFVVRNAHWEFGRSMAAVPCPKVIFKYQGKAYLPAPDLMRLPPPSQEELEQTTARLKALPRNREERGLEDDRDIFEDEFWWVVLDLVYSGNMESALYLFEQAIPVGLGEDAPTVEQLMDALRRSSYKDLIYELNRKPQDSGLEGK